MTAWPLWSQVPIWLPSAEQIDWPGELHEVPPVEPEAFPLLLPELELEDPVAAGEAGAAWLATEAAALATDCAALATEAAAEAWPPELGAPAGGMATTEVVAGDGAAAAAEPEPESAPDELEPSELAGAAPEPAPDESEPPELEPEPPAQLPVGGARVPPGVFWTDDPGSGN